MQYGKAKEIADRLVSELRPHCIRIEIAGSIRRQVQHVKDIEIVAIPKPYDVGLFESGIASVLNKYVKVRGELPCKYTCRLLPEGIKLDFFTATPDNWGLILAIRTGSADYSKTVLARNWVHQGYHSVDGHLTRGGWKVPVRTEAELFEKLHMDYVCPTKRNLQL